MHVLIADHLASMSDFTSALSAAAPKATISVWPYLRTDAPVDLLVVWKLPDDMTTVPSGVRAVFCLGAGAAHLLDEPRIPRGMPIVRNLDDGQAEQMLDFVLHAVLSKLLQSDRHVTAQRSALWARPSSARPPREDIRVTLLGYGHIGKRVYNGLQAYGFTPARWTRSPGPEDVGLFRGYAALEAACEKADVLVSILPPGEDTKDIVSNQVLSVLKQGAYFVNVGRGDHVDEAALLSSIASGQISMAYLDTFREEPLPKDHPFWSHPNIRVTPHLAALPTSVGTAAAIAAVLAALESGVELPGRLIP